MRKVIAILSVATALLLSGCSQVGEAASVGSEKITQASVQKSVDAVIAERAKVSTAGMQVETGETLNRSQLRFHVVEILLRAVAAEGKISVTKAEIDQRRATIITQVGGIAKLPTALVGAGIAKADLNSYLELIIISEKLSTAATAAGVAADNVGAEIQKLMVKKANELKVTVNPRYGKWDATIGDIVATDSASSANTPAAAPPKTP